MTSNFNNDNFLNLVMANKIQDPFESMETSLKSESWIYNGRDLNYSTQSNILQFNMDRRVPSFVNMSSKHNYTAPGTEESNCSEDNMRMDIDSSYTNQNDSSINQKIEQHLDIFKNTLTFQTSSPMPKQIKQEIIDPEEYDPQTQNTTTEEDLKLQQFYVEQCLKKKVTEEKSYFRILVFLLLPLNLIFAGIAISSYYNFSYEHYDKGFDLVELKQDLDLSLYGQGDVITKLMEITSNLGENKFNLLIGNSGVGKTLTINILNRHYQSPNIIHLISPIHTNFGGNKLKLIQNLSENDDYNLILIDSLKIDDLDDIFLLKFLEELRQYPVIVFMAVTGPKESLDKDFIRKFNVNLLGFKNLSRDVLVKCIEASLVKRNLSLTKDNVDYVFNHLGDFQTGCKRIDTKVALLYEN